MFWRPVTAIQEGDNDFNGRTAGDPAWLPLIVTPNYPDYTSGANSSSGSMTRSLALFFGRDKRHLLGDEPPPPGREEGAHLHPLLRGGRRRGGRPHLLGIHFRFADVDARRQAERVAEWVFKRFLRPVRGHHDDDDDDHGDDDDGDDDDDDRWARPPLAADPARRDGILAVPARGLP